MQPRHPDNYRAYQLTKTFLDPNISHFPFRHEDLLAANDTEEGRAVLQNLVNLVKTSAAEVIRKTDELRREGTPLVDRDGLQDQLNTEENLERFTTTDQLSALIKSLAQAAVSGPRIQVFSESRMLELNNLKDNPLYRTSDKPNKEYIDIWEIATAQKNGKPVAESLAAFQDGTYTRPSEQE